MKRMLLIFLSLFLISPYAIYAKSAYVLPYPSVMPGSSLYKLHVLWEKIMAYWYFGNLGQFRYNLKESDKYLVEAKTLCEYEQYLLCSKTLEKSNAYFTKIYPFLLKARKQGKDISLHYALFIAATEKHREVLERMRRETPESFLWSPEKSPSSYIYLHQRIDVSIEKRRI